MERDLCIDLCVTVLKYMRNGFLKTGTVTIDVDHLRDWLTKNEGAVADALFADDTVLRAAIGYGHFFKDLCQVNTK